MTRRRDVLRGATLLALSLGTARSARAQIVPGGRGDDGADRVLRVCADPNNMPFSNARGEGFENKIAELLAKEIGARVEYLWWAQRRGFVRNTLKARDCDAVIGMPRGDDMVLETQPYYRSTYVFLYRKDRGYHLSSLDDPALKTMRIGVHFIGTDYNNPPVVQALVRRGIRDRVIGYSIYGDYSKPNPPAALVAAVARGDIDVALIWGPFAGYFAPRQRVPLEIVPVTPETDRPALHFAFDIAVGVRRGDDSLRVTLQRALDARRAQIQRILAHYGVPQVEMRVAVAECAAPRGAAKPKRGSESCE